MADDDDRRRDARRRCRLHVRLVAHRKGGGAGDAREAGHEGHGDDEHHVPEAAAEHRRDHDGQQQLRKRQQRIDQAAQHPVRPAAEIAGRHPDDGADEGRQDRRDQAEDQRVARTVDEARQDIPAELVHSDIVISSTASQLPILGKGAVESALKLRKHKPIFMVDIAVPRDIEPEVGELDDVYLYSVDDLHEVVAENLKSRQGAAQAAEEMITIGAEDFMVRLRELAAVDVLKAYRQQSERLRDEELQKAQRLLANGGSAEEVLVQLARGLTNKLLHAPSVQLKKLTAEGRLDALAMAQELFALGEGSPDSFSDKKSQ